MKKRNIVILIILLAIGFASVATNLIINGNLNVGYNENEFKSNVVFTKAETLTGTATINGEEKNIDFASIKLENINQSTILNFDVTNKSRNYDANVTITCGLKEEFTSYNDYLDIAITPTSPFELLASETKSGVLTVSLKKAYDESLETSVELKCELIATPVERDTLGDEYIPPVYVDETLNGADPVLKDRLIPITLSDDGTVKYANTSEEWYNYENKRWANAVILEDNLSYNVGDTIPEESIESYFVWIPKFSYQIWDIGNYDKLSSLDDDKVHEIQIRFGLDNTISSNNKECTPSSKQNEATCDVGDYMTHPAFTNFDINGLWVGKFETGYKGATTTESAQLNANDASKVIVKPNTFSWRNNTVSNMFKSAYNYERDLDSHMMKNTEWGAAAYLSHSKYGINTEVRINNNSNYLTGYASVENPTCFTGGESEECNQFGFLESITQPYNTLTGYKASTTGNITGIYDMSGGAWEYMAAYMPSTSDASGFTSQELLTHSHYLDVYSNASSINSYNKRILGDATGEMGPLFDKTIYYSSSWYGDVAGFIELINPWFVRGGYYGHGILSGQFSFDRYKGTGFAYFGSRLVLTPQ